MRKGIFLAFASLFILGGQAFGQTASGTTTLKVTLAQVQTITVKHSDVELNYATAADYTNGVGVTKQDHIEVDSSDDFKIQVKTSGADLTGTGSNTDLIAAGSISVLASDGSTSPANNGQYTSVNLSTTEQTVITADAGMGRNFDVKYSGAGSDAYAGKAADTYSTTVTYTLSPQ